MGFSGPLLLAVLALLEVFYVKYHKKEAVFWRDVIYNMNSGLIMMWIFRGVELAGFQYVLTNFSLNIVNTWSQPTQWVFTFFAWDFCFYWLHRMHHKIPLFWNIHVVHHEGEHFGLSLGMRNSWYSSLSSFPFFVGLAFLGVPIEKFIAISGFHYFMQFYNHNRVVGDSGFLEHFMVTPKHHRVHHGSNPEYIDKNFSGTFKIWDKLFGTCQTEVPGVKMKFGVHNPIKSENPFWGNNIPFMQSLNMKIPNLEQNDAAGKMFTVKDSFIASGGVLIYSFVVYYIYREVEWVGIQQLSLYILILLSTIALGGISDNRLWGMISWITLGTVLSTTFVWHYSVFDPWALSLFAIFFIHGLSGLYQVFKANNKSELPRLEM